MLNYDSSENLASFLGYQSEEIQTAPGVQRDDVSFLQSYDDMISETIVNVEEKNAVFEEAHDDAKETIVNSYETVKQTFTNISQNIKTSRNIALVLTAGAISLFIWDKLGRDVYKMAKAKK